MRWSMSLLLFACRGQQPEVGGCRYEQRQGKCALISDENGPANTNEPGLVEVKGTYQWVGELPPQFHDKTTIVRWNVPQEKLQDGIDHLKAHPEVACTVGINVGGSCPPDGPKIDPGALPPPSFAR
jgi:hypothetical protein